MLIRPTDSAQLTRLTGVADSGKSMERDARERHGSSGRGHVEEDPEERRDERESSDHLIDEVA
ncbi:MAG: hypothetical protein IT209_03710 [Armatimonadetes bacterium]|nr:hypothetical protein [Armatimonadota bacterium]